MVSQENNCVTPYDYVNKDRLDVFTRTPLVRSWKDDKFAHNEALHRYLSFIRLAAKETGYIEANGKKNIDQYFKEFKKLHDSLLEFGYKKSMEPIPVKNKIIQNGAHRLAIALSYNIEINVREIKSDHEEIQDYKYLKKIGYPESMIKKTVLEYLNFDMSSRVLIFFGLTQKRINSLISDLDSIIYRTKINLSENGAVKIMKVIYGHLDWWNDELCQRFKDERFDDSRNEIELILYNLPKTLSEKEIKNRVRQKLRFHQFERKVHGTDDWFESKILCDQLLNDNTIFYLNSTDVNTETRILNLLTQQKNLSLFNRDIIITSGAVLEIFGIRKAKDIDYLILNNREDYPSDYNYDISNREYEHLGLNYKGFFYDSNSYFTYCGFNFLSLSELIAFKFQRQTSKDILDLKLIADFLKNNSFSINKKKQKINLPIVRNIFLKLLTKLYGQLNSKQKTLIKRYIFFYLKNIKNLP